MRRHIPQQIECPQCHARRAFQRASAPRLDSSGFESYQLQCQNCHVALVGIVDPFDGKLLLSLRSDADYVERPHPA
jgi:hypothetical protein